MFSMQKNTTANVLTCSHIFSYSDIIFRNADYFFIISMLHRYIRLTGHSQAFRLKGKSSSAMQIISPGITSSPNLSRTEKFLSAPDGFFAFIFIRAEPAGISQQHVNIRNERNIFSPSISCCDNGIIAPPSFLMSTLFCSKALILSIYF